MSEPDRQNPHKVTALKEEIKRLNGLRDEIHRFQPCNSIYNSLADLPPLEALYMDLDLGAINAMWTDPAIWTLEAAFSLYYFARGQITLDANLDSKIIGLYMSTIFSHLLRLHLGFMRMLVPRLETRVLVEFGNG